MKSAQTFKIGSAVALSGSYVDLDTNDGEGVPALAENQQCVVTIKRTGGSTVTFKLAEQFNGLTGFIPKTEDDGTNLTLIERTSTETNFSYAFQSIAEALRVSVKGAGTVDVYLTIGDI